MLASLQILIHMQALTLVAQAVLLNEMHLPHHSP
jgi:hypothetical protein